MRHVEVEVALQRLLRVCLCRSVPLGGAMPLWAARHHRRYQACGAGRRLPVAVVGDEEQVEVVALEAEDVYSAGE